mmetsp:Transcript_34212/g.90164  ORF Transcript_34212/g.90164 Transcript_34212/m.90164 type:complete len:121 (-) Transcript_34212:32-394(-)
MRSSLLPAIAHPRRFHRFHRRCCRHRRHHHRCRNRRRLKHSHVIYRRGHPQIMAKLQEHGCVWFKDMELTKSPEGFRSFYDALGLDLCLDPIHTSGLRKMISKKASLGEWLKAHPTHDDP